MVHSPWSMVGRKKRYLDLNSWLKGRVGEKVFKVSLTASTTCPNIDGTLAKGGCVFCNDASYAPLNFNRREKPIFAQLKEGIEYIKRRHHASKFISYFQSFTSTYGDREALLKKFKESLEHPDVVGFALSTRPDCIDKRWAQDLTKLGNGKLCWIEFGLQSANDETLKKINRWHTARQFTEAVKMWKENSDWPLCAHVIIGLPGEKREEVLRTARFLASQATDGVKIHNLHVVKGTALAKAYLEGDYKPLTLEEYTSLAVDFLELTPPHVLIHRLNAHAPRHLTLAPEWSVNKLAIFNAVEKEMERRDTWQGKALGFSIQGGFLEGLYAPSDKRPGGLGLEEEA